MSTLRQIQPAVFNQNPSASDPSAQGFTILEVIASVVILAVAIVSVAPALLVATITRVHSQRLEVSSNLVTEQIEDIQAKVSRGPASYTSADLPPLVGNSDVVPPNGRIEAYPPAPAEPEYYIQSFRFNEVNCVGVTPAKPCVFSVGVRVYSALAFPGGSYAGGTDVTPLQGSVGSVEGALSAKEQPLASVTAEVGFVSTLQEFCLKAGSTTCP